MAFDLDDDELKATRRMNGSDKNVGSMKEDIQLVGNLIKEYRLYGDLDGIAINDMSVYINAIEHLIKAYKELEEYYEEQNEVNAKFIPVSLVEEKIEEYQNNMKLYENETHNIFNENNIRQEVITVLQELLEKR